MPAQVKTEIQLEIAHVLFIDIVGYSKLSINQQRAAVDELTQIVRATEQFQKAEAADRLIKIATGDGMALVFYTSAEAPVRCAVELGRALKHSARLRVRMGVHSGPVSGVVDVAGHANLTGAGLNLAHRVMGCGDAGHILLSKRVAEDLAEFEEWRPLLHDLGTCEVKHGAQVGVVNLWSDDVGNSQVPERFRALKKQLVRTRMAVLAFALLLLTAIIAAFAVVLKRSTGPPSIIPEKSIAVLPFENLSDDTQNSYFAAGVQDEIISNLARIADLKVISRTSANLYKSENPRNSREIGQQLGVAHLLEGSVQRIGNRLRVNAQLINAHTDTHVWAQTYDRDVADLFAIQSELAQAIAGQLYAKISPAGKLAIERAPTADITAFDLYSQSKDLVLVLNDANDRENLLRAADLLNQAVARDPTYFHAYCQLAWVHDQLYHLHLDRTPARLALAEAAIQAAFRLRPDAGEAHLARAEHLYRGFLDYEGALAELEIARQTLPNNARLFELKGYIERRRPGGNQEEALRSLERAINLDPRNFLLLQQTALSYEFLRRYREEEAAYDRLLSIAPNDAPSKISRALTELAWKADTHRLHQAVDEVRAKDPAAVPSIAGGWLECALAERDPAAAAGALAALGDNSLGPTTLRYNPRFLAGLIARMTKDDAKAHAAFTAARAEQEKLVRARPDDAGALSVLGLIDAALGRKEEALREGRRAVELLPVEKDAINGTRMITSFANIAAWVGDKELACEQLAIAIRPPSEVSYGELKLLPWWDPLRGDPCFERIVASLAPKEN
jgi:TolB-like protein/class 3 adenylate cyclase/Flp pilus assembly protein TadD